MHDLLLLHGAIGSKDQLQDLSIALRPHYNVHTLNFCGHGGEPFASDFSIQGFAASVQNYMAANAIASAHIFGYSMGGYVGMYLAKNHPALVTKLVTLATKFYWDESVAAKEMKMLDASVIRQKVPAFAQQLAKRHGEDNWITLLDKTKDLLFQLGNNNQLQPHDYTGIASECLVMLGDRDKMVTMEETISTYLGLKTAQLCILPATTHPIEQVDIAVLTFHLRRFLG